MNTCILSTQRARPAGALWLLLSCSWLLLSCPASGQSLRKLERNAINRTHLTFVNGDTVQRFTVTYDRPTPRTGRFYYWQGPTQILRTAGAYNGHLLTGDYQLTSRNGNLLGRGQFYKGLKTGEWRTWRPDGTPVSSSNWRQGRQRGKTKHYDEAGQRLRPVVLPKPAAPVGVEPAKPRFWQPAYWQGLVQRRKLRRAEKRQAKETAPKPVKTKKVKGQKIEGQPGEPAPSKKVKRQKTKAQLPTPGLAPLSPGATP